MLNLRKFVSVITLISFLATNISYADKASTFKLATPTKFGRMKDLEFKEAAQIRIGIMDALKRFESIDLDSLRELGEKEFFEQSVFSSRISAVFNFNQAVEGKLEGINAEKDCYIFKARVKSAAGQDDNVYYCLISRSKVDGQFPISVISERVMQEALKEGAVKFTHGSVDAKDAEIISKYTEHEITTANNEAIDPWIRKHMEAGKYAVNENASKQSLYENAEKIYSNEIYEGLLTVFVEYFQNSGVPQETLAALHKQMMSKPLIIIPYEKKSDLPRINIYTQPVMVEGHSSEFVTYIFLPRLLYSAVSMEKEECSPEVFQTLAQIFFHEIGARCGLDFRAEDGKARNLIDDYLSSGAAMQYEGPVLAIKNLLELELRNDYAAGEVNDGRKKNIFRRVITVAIAGAVGVGAFLYSRMTTDVPQMDNKGETKAGEKESTKKPIGAVIDVPVEGEVREAVETSEKTEQKSQEKDVPTLISDLKSEDYLTQHEATAKLAEMIDKDERITPALIEVLKDKDNDMCIEAAKALSNAKDKEAILALIDKLKSRVSSIMLEEALVWSLGQIGEPAIPMIIDALKESGPVISLRLEQSLCAIGKPALKPVLELLKDSNMQIRLKACDTLQLMGDYVRLGKATIPSMVLEGSFPVTPASPDFIDALKKDAVPALITAIDDKEGFISREAIAALGSMGEIAKEAVPALIQNIIKDKTNSSAVRALGQIRDERAIVTLQMELSLVKEWDAYSPENNEEYREAIIEALGYFGPQSGNAANDMITAYKNSGSTGRRKTVEAISNIAERKVAVPFLITALDDKDSLVRGDAAYRLVHLKADAKQAVPALIKALRKGGEDSASGCAYALGEIRDEEAIEPLLQSLDEFKSKPLTLYDLTFTVRKQIVVALGKYGPLAKKALPKLKVIAEKDENEEVREAAKEAIKNIERNLVNEVSNALIERLWNGDSIKTGNDRTDTELSAVAFGILTGLSVPIGKWKSSDDINIDINAIVKNIKEEEIEVFIPKSELPDSTHKNVRDALSQIFGDKLRVYNNINDLPGMVKNPAKSIIMTVGISSQDVALTPVLSKLEGVRLMNFQQTNIDELIEKGLHENYIKDTLTKLLVARIITPEEGQKPLSEAYILLSNLLVGHLDEDEIDGYIKELVDESAPIITKLVNLVNKILKALPIEAFKDEALKPAVQVLWSA